MKYTIKQFNEKFPDDDACLQYIFEQRFGNKELERTLGITYKTA